MYYVIFAQDKPNTLAQRLAVREQHLARLKPKIVCSLQVQIPRLMMKIRVKPVSPVRPSLPSLIACKQQKTGQLKILMSKPACMAMSLLSRLKKYFNFQTVITETC